MRFTLYTDKTVAQCVSALNERLHAKEANTRAGWGGKAEKNGEFSMALSSKVARRFTRTTRLHGKIEREAGVTMIQGYVPDGVSGREQLTIFGAIALVAVILLAGGNALLAIVALLAGGALYIPLRGDYKNSEVLMRELRSVLKAKETPPKKPAQIKPAASSSALGARPKTPLGSSLSTRKPTPAPKKRPTTRK